MSNLIVRQGPYDTAPMPQGGVAIYRVSRSGAERVGRPQGDLVKATLNRMVDRLSGKPSFYTISLDKRMHPSVTFKKSFEGGGQDVKITLKFAVAVSDPDAFFSSGKSDLTGHFDLWLEGQLSVVSSFGTDQWQQAKNAVERAIGARYDDGQVELSDPVLVDFQSTDATTAKLLAEKDRLPLERVHSAQRINENAALIKVLIGQYDSAHGDELAQQMLVQAAPELRNAFQEIEGRHNNEELKRREKLKWLIDHNIVNPEEIKQQMDASSANWVKALVEPLGAPRSSPKSLPKPKPKP